MSADLSARCNDIAGSAFAMAKAFATRKLVPRDFNSRTLYHLCLILAGYNVDMSFIILKWSNKLLSAKAFFHYIHVKLYAISLVISSCKEANHFPIKRKSIHIIFVIFLSLHFRCIIKVESPIRG